MEKIPAIRGFAASELLKPEAGEVLYNRGGVEKDALELAYDADFNSVLFDVYNKNVDSRPTRMSMRDIGFRFMFARLMPSIRLHIGPTGAAGEKPSSWDGISDGQLDQAVWNLGHVSLATLGGARALPGAVVIGDDISGGIIFPEGKLDGSDEAFGRFTHLLKKLIEGITFACPTARVILPWNSVADADGAERFFAKLAGAGIDFMGVAVPVCEKCGTDAAIEKFCAAIGKLGKFVVAAPCSVSGADQSAQARYIEKLDSFAADEDKFAAFAGYILDNPFEKGGETSLIDADGNAREAFAPRERKADPFPMPPYSRFAKPGRR